MFEQMREIPCSIPAVWCCPKLGSIPIFTVVFALTGFVLPGAQAAPRAPLTSPPR